MNHPRAWLAAAIAAFVVPVPGQERSGERNSLVEGWLMELLDRDHQAAATQYRAAALDDQTPALVRFLALARIGEIELIADSGLDMNALEQQLRSQGSRGSFERLRPNRGDDPRKREAEALQQEFLAALAIPAGKEREARLTSLRARLDDLIEARSSDLRPWVRSILQMPGSDLREPSTRPRSTTLSDMRRQNRMRFAEVLRLRLDGQDEQAERLTATLRFQRGPNRRNEPVVVDDPKQTLELAIARLDELLGRERADISAEERQNLKRLLDRLQTWKQEGGEADAIAFLRALPFYDGWLLSGG